jgi:NAD(P)-dependent dehydrogenase (short-subunit alcohol dehydrogenase family)
MNKTALITGTSRGLGQALAKSLLDDNWNVIGLSRTCSIEHCNYTHYIVDIGNTDHLLAIFKNLKDIKLDLLINNSAIFSNSLFSETSTNTITDIINTNVTGTIMVTHGSLNLLVDGSKIIFVNSVAGLNDLLGQSVYCASKHAIKSFAGVLAQELRSRKIRVSNIHPGGMNTSLWNSIDNPYPPGNVEEAMSIESIIDVLKMIIDCRHNIDFKNVTMFPLIEWH